MRNEDALYREWQETGEIDSLYKALVIHARRIIFSILRTENDDLARDIALKGITEAKTFLGRSQFSTWFHSLAVNECLQLLRQRRVRGEKSLEDLTGKEYLRLVSETSTNTDLRDIPMTDIERAVVECRTYGHTHEETAEKLLIPYWSVRRIWKRACQKITEYLGG